MFTYIYTEIFPKFDYIFVVFCGFADMPLSSWINLLTTEYSYSSSGFLSTNIIHTFTIGNFTLTDFGDVLVGNLWSVFNEIIFLGVPLDTPLWVALLMSLPTIFVLSIVIKWL